MAMPTHAKTVIIGAGIHGLSTAWHLGEQRRGNGNGGDILVLDKTGIAAGASGIACGVVRNNYYQPAMRELMALCVEVWESDPKAFSYHPVGYMQISPEAMRADVATIHEQQTAIGYESVFVEGEGRVHGLHERTVRRLAGQGHHLGPAREEGRLRQQHGRESTAWRARPRRPACAS